MSTSLAGPRRRRFRFGPEALILLGAAAFALLGRGRWADVVADHGFWYSAVQGLLSGGRAMHEVRVQYGPVSLWILEGACRLFGASVVTIVATQFFAGLGAILGLALYSRRFLGPAERWISAAGLTTLILWMSGPGNLLYPSAFAMSHALALAVLTVALHDVFLRRGLLSASLFSGALAGVTFLTKQEFGLAAAAGIAALTLCDPRLARSRRLGAALLSGLGFAGAYAGILELARGRETLARLVRSNILWPWAPVPAPWRGLFLRSLGLDRPAHTMLVAADAALTVLLFGGAAWLILYGSLVRHGRRIALLLAVAAAAGGWIWRWTEGSQFLPMTLALLALLAAGILAVRRERSASGVEGMRETGAYLAVWFGAVLLLQREGYRGLIDGYYSGMGYVLAVPAVVPLIWLLARGPRGAGKRRAVAMALLAFLAADFGVHRVQALRRSWDSAIPFTTERGTVYLTPAAAPAVLDTARFLRLRTRAGSSVLMLPETFGLDFMLDRVNLSLFPYVSPGYLTEEGESDLVARCEKRRPAAAVVFQGTFPFLRSGDFGTGFASRLTAWVEKSFPQRESFLDGELRGVRYWR